MTNSFEERTYFFVKTAVIVMAKEGGYFEFDKKARFLSAIPPKSSHH